MLEPQPDSPLTDPLQRRWLHYAFVSQQAGLALIANLSTLGADGNSAPQQMNIVLVHDAHSGWSCSQFNATAPEQPWSSFRQNSSARALGLTARSGHPAVQLELTRTSRPCTSQCAPFGSWQHLRWQSETGIVADGDWHLGAHDVRTGIRALGYHERVRGRWGWPDLGGWVFGFANDPATPADGRGAPPWAVVFTLIQPSDAADHATGSIMLWRDGRLVRHFPRRDISVTVRGVLHRDLVTIVPPLAGVFGTPPGPAVPRHLTIQARMGADEVVLDVECRTAARIVNPSETSVRPFSVHEVLGECTVAGSCGGVRLEFATQAVVEFAGGAIDG
jgi:hypothetical protein